MFNVRSERTLQFARTFGKLWQQCSTTLVQLLKPQNLFSSGIIRFAQTIKAYEKQDEEIATLNSKLRSIVMPQMAAPPPEPSNS